MEHVGIDLGSRHSDVCIVDSTGKKTLEKRVETRRLEEYLKSRPKSHVVMEACAESPKIATVAKLLGHEAKVVPGKLVRLLGVGDRNIKTDKKDALALALASHRNPELPSVHIRSERAASWRSLLGSRDQVVSTRTTHVNFVRGYARQRIISFKGRLGPQMLQRLRDELVLLPEGIPAHMEEMFSMISYCDERIAKLTETVTTIAEGDELCRRLMTMPGVGPITVLRFVSALDDVKRFPSAENVASYLALVPSESTTGGKIRRGHLIDSGPSMLRATLVQSAWTLWRCRKSDPAVKWAELIAERRNKRIAVVALARKIAITLYAMWRDGTSFDPTRMAKKPAPAISPTQTPNSASSTMSS